jgi:putative ubiquitin-RnfH superfamily antitoxin RatB of RatAB toxin-antitoxin module
MPMPLLRITLVYAPAPRTVFEAALTVPPGHNLGQALARAGWFQRFPEIQDADLTFGIWGRKADAHTLLQDGDRVEVYRPLRVDPKVARRERFVGQGTRGTGLFNRRRPGSKAGY